MFGKKKNDFVEDLEKIPPVSMYSDITDEALETIHAQFTARYGASLHDESKSIQERSLETLARTKEEIHAVQEFVKEYVYRQLKELALIIYLAMKKSNDYGGMGEDRVKISFMRNILGIPNNQQVDYSDEIQFDRIIDEFDNRHGKKSGDEYIKIINTGSLTLFNKKYVYSDVVQLIEVFDILKVPYSVYRTYDMSYKNQFILAECETVEYDKYTAYMFRREYIRSPQENLSTVAHIYNKGTVVRREAIELTVLIITKRIF